MEPITNTDFPPETRPSGDSLPSRPKEAPPLCPECGGETIHHPRNRGERLCVPCWDKKREARAIAEFTERIDEWAVEQALRAGMSPREVKATRERIPIEIKRALPREEVQALLEGKIPTKGFGLGGHGTGAGKTSALAAILRDAIRAQGLATAKARTCAEMAPWLVWESWPSAVAWMRSNATGEAFPGFLARLIEAPVLFLDDLGSERIKGSYVEDFAASQLDVVIDDRYRHERPTFYTTNLDLAGLLDFYGARLVSRLCGDNPLFVVEGLKDQRFAR